MNQRIFSIIFFLLLLGVLYFLFSPQTPVEDITDVNDSLVEKLPSSANDTASPDTVEADDIKTGNIEFTGVLEGFSDGKDEFLGSYKYALIYDDIELLQIDLRPLVGYDVTDLEGDLGVKVGEVVTVTGKMEDSLFVITGLR